MSKFKADVTPRTLEYKRYYEVFPEITDFLMSIIKRSDRVLEIGPGATPFPGATHFMGHAQNEINIYGDKYAVCDVAQDKFPFEDNYFDFVYSRHVLEDTLNPMHAVKEIARTCKRGYLETPSPIAECWPFAESPFGLYKGFCHHRYFVWNDGRINFMAKFPIIEKINFNNEALNEKLQDPYNWITPYLFEGNIDFKHHQHGWDTEFMVNNTQSYVNVINHAVDVSIKQAQHFKEKINDKRR